MFRRLIEISEKDLLIKFVKLLYSEKLNDAQLKDDEYIISKVENWYEMNLIDAREYINLIDVLIEHWQPMSVKQIEIIHNYYSNEISAVYSYGFFWKDCNRRDHDMGELNHYNWVEDLDPDWNFDAFESEINIDLKCKGLEFEKYIIKMIPSFHDQLESYFEVTTTDIDNHLLMLQNSCGEKYRFEKVKLIATERIVIREESR